jgi:hypothetical protein
MPKYSATVCMRLAVLLNISTGCRPPVKRIRQKTHLPKNKKRHNHSLSKKKVVKKNEIVVEKNEIVVENKEIVVEKKESLVKTRIDGRTKKTTFEISNTQNTYPWQHPYDWNPVLCPADHRRSSKCGGHEGCRCLQCPWTEQSTHISIGHISDRSPCGCYEC